MSSRKPSNPIALFTQFKHTLNNIHSIEQKNEDQQKDEQFIQEITIAKMKEKYQSQIKTLKEILKVKDQLLEQVSRKIQDLDKEHINNYKRQFRRLIDSLSEKESEIQTLNKQVARQKNRISALQTDISVSKEAKDYAQHSFLKGIQLVKAQIKQLGSISDQTELGKFIVDNSYKQTTEKLQTIANMYIQLQQKKKSLEEKCYRLRKECSQITSKNTELEIQIQRQKQLSYQARYFTKNDKKNSKGLDEDVSQQSFISKQSFHRNQLSQKSKNISSNQLSKNQKVKQRQDPLLQKLQQAISLLSQEQNQTFKSVEKINRIYTKFQQENQFWAEIIQIKEENRILQNQINDARLKSNPFHSEEILQKDYPKLYEFFKQKMLEIQNFQHRLDNLQRNSMKVVDMLDNFANEGLPQKNHQSSQTQLIQKQRVVKSKLKRQLTQKFDLQKVQLKNQIEKKFQQQIDDFKCQIKRLQDKNEDLYLVIQQMNQKQKRKEQAYKTPEIKHQHQRIQVEAYSNNKMEQKNPTSYDSQSDTLSYYNKVNGNKIIKQTKEKDQQLINYLQIKSQKLEKDNEELKKKINQYKNQLKFIMQNYRVKSVSIKGIRCNQCYLQVKDQAKNCQKCLNCKMEFHKNSCMKIHAQFCKKISPKRGPKPKLQAKKNANHASTTAVSQLMDYF